MNSCRTPAIFSDDLQATELRDALINWTPMTLKSCLEIPGSSIGGVRIYSDGVFDLFHNGHAEQLRQAKTLLPNVYLIVGVCTDKDVIAFKGTRPVMTQEERCATVRHCRYVDEVVASPPFYPTLEFVAEIKADLVAHDDLPYAVQDTTDCYAPFKKADRFLTTERTPMVSTTELLARIMDNLELFKNREKMRSEVFKTCKAQVEVDSLTGE